MLIRTHSFSKERVNVREFDPFKRAEPQTFRCERCHRDLPDDQFVLIGSSDYKRKSVFLRHVLCHTCRQQVRGAHVKHPLYAPYLDRFFTKLATSMRGGAKARGILCGVDKDDLLGLYLDQGGLCAITVLKLDCSSERGGTRDQRSWLRPSVDRKSSEGNYTIGNIHVVAHALNIMKADLPMEVFVALCEKVAERRLSGDI